MPNPVPQGYNVFFDIIQLIQDEGVDLPFQPTLNFVGAGVIASDDPGNNRTLITIPGSTPHDLLDGNIIQDSVANIVSAGSLVFGNLTPLWDELVIGTAGQILTVVAGLPEWTDPTAAMVNTFILGFADDGALPNGGTEFASFFSDGLDGSENEAQGFLAFTFTVKRVTVQVGSNTSSGITDIVMRDDGVDVPNTTFNIPASTTGSFDSGAISESITSFSLIGLKLVRNGSSTFGDYAIYVEAEK